MAQVLELPVPKMGASNLISIEQPIKRIPPALAYHRVVLVSSHPLYLVGLRGELTPWDDFKVVGEACDTAGVLSLVSSSPVSLIIVDQARPGEALPLLRTLQQKLQGRIPVVVLGASENEAQIEQLYQLGVTRFAFKTLEGQELHNLLSKVMEGRRPLPGGIRYAEPESWPARLAAQPQPVAGVRRGKTGELKGRTPLSPREIQILEVIAQGHSNKEVANELCISNHTLKNHLNNIFKKLNVEDRTQALMLGVRNGWIRL
jgi:DNA-binding NarL/FixJ family response regulator